MRVLTRNVTVHVDGEPVDVGPGACPDRLARLIQRNDVWADADETAEDETVEAEAERPAGNATREAWVAYAGTLDLEVEDDMKREDIIALVDLADADETAEDEE